MSKAAFKLDSQLAAGTFFIGKLKLCRVFLMNDSRWPWLMLVPEIPDIIELTDLSAEDQAILIREADFTARLVQKQFSPDKMNIGSMGNIVPQFHLHIVARHKNDAAWPEPVWGFAGRIPYEPEEVERLLSILGKDLAS
ncbi:HIT domain-containing protein [Aureimonas fodinaquatilis]|uniref:HIT domain-containing protein n=1 Tax=Aureimonas fodinaquatilis TaxID=2565783 RepID=A0A5B0E301_9HYPH|nr:HIT family protein [Aureimonas fodinaquatilis]KAA0972341.1 HIT domain-containing protein [Aureimonas fodinaquatilis]